MIGITDFLNEYKLAKDKQKYIAQHITTKYLPFEQKDAQCKNIVDFSMYKTVNGKKIFWINTPLRYQLFTQTIIKLYTDIDLADGANPKEDISAILRGFNKLEESNAMVDITQAIGEDFSRFQTTFNMKVDDEIANATSLTNYLDTKMEAFATVLGTFESAMNKVIENNPELLGTKTE